MLKFSRFLPACLTILLLAAAPSNGRQPVQEDIIRVAIIEGAKKLEISGEGLYVAVEGRHSDADDKIVIEAVGSGFEINGKKYPSPVRVNTAGGVVYVNNRQYRGYIFLHREKSGILVVDVLPLETYLVGLINAEVNSKWPIEAVKSQAVVARTFALKKSEERRTKLFDVRADVSDQVYHGSSIEDEESERAVAETRGQVLAFEHKLANAYYHSTCGGRTASAAEVWGHDKPYLRGVECEWCVDSPRYFWKLAVSADDIEAKLHDSRIHLAGLNGIRIVDMTPSGRAATVHLTGESVEKNIPAAEFRAAMGYTKIFSTRFEIFEPESGQFVFMGRGSGHGVGMCQYGARGQALAGRTYREILSFYYPGADIMERAVGR